MRSLKNLAVVLGVSAGAIASANDATTQTQTSDNTTTTLEVDYRGKERGFSYEGSIAVFGHPDQRRSRTFFEHYFGYKEGELKDAPEKEIDKLRTMYAKERPGNLKRKAEREEQERLARENEPDYSTLVQETPETTWYDEQFRLQSIWFDPSYLFDPRPIIFRDNHKKYHKHKKSERKKRK